MTNDPLLQRLSSANPAREDEFLPHPAEASRLRAGGATGSPQRVFRWRPVLAAVVGISALGALIAVLPRGQEAPSSAPVQQVVPSPGVPPATTTGPGVGESVEVSVWLRPQASAKAIDALRARLDALAARGSVEAFTYVSASDALKELRGRLRDPSVLDELPGNPMPASFRVRTSDPDGVRAALSGDPAIDPALGLSIAPTRTEAPTP